MTPRDQAQQIAIDAGLDLASILGPNGRIAVGDPANVPAGIYTRQALTRLGLSGIAEPRLSRAENVRGALLLVGRGEVPLGIVYATDAATTPRVAIAGTFPAASHEPIVYPFAIPRTGGTPQARALLEFIAGPQGAEIFTRRGFRTE